jgi:hypothetical protein
MAVHALESVEKPAHRFIVEDDDRPAGVMLMDEDDGVAGEDRSDRIVGVDGLRAKALVADAFEVLEVPFTGDALEAFQLLVRRGYFCRALDLNRVRWGDTDEHTFCGNLDFAMEWAAGVCYLGAEGVEGWMGGGEREGEDVAALVRRITDSFVDADEVEVYGEETENEDRVKCAGFCCLRKLIQICKCWGGETSEHNERCERK